MEEKTLKIEKYVKDEEFLPEIRERSHNRFVYQHLAITADRFRVRYRATAAIVNAASKDMLILNESNMLGRKKVGKEKNCAGKINVIRPKL